MKEKPPSKFDEVLKRMLTTPPHQPKPKPKGEKPAKKNPAK
jgi:hypothetical protein